MYVGVRNGYRKKGGLPNVLQVQILYPTICSAQYHTYNLMNTNTKVKNQGEQLKVKRTNYLTPPYTKPSEEERKRWEQSKQLTILPPLQPTPQQLIQHQQVKNPNQLAKSNPTPKNETRTKPLTPSASPTKATTKTVKIGNKQLQLPTDKKELAKMAQREYEYWRNLPDIT